MVDWNRCCLLFVIDLMLYLGFVVEVRGVGVVRRGATWCRSKLWVSDGYGNVVRRIDHVRPGI